MPELRHRYYSPTNCWDFGDERCGFPEVTSECEYVAPSDIGNSSCRVGEQLPDNGAGLIDANGNVTWLRGYSLCSGTVRIHPEEAQKAQEHGWAIVGWPDEKWCLVDRRSRDFPKSDYSVWPSERAADAETDRLIDADQAARFFDSDGEPPVSPPPPNIGGEDHPPYAGPNYADEHEIADEMKGIRHYGLEKDDD